MVSYLTPDRLATLRRQLTPEDWAVLHDVQAMRLAQATDLQALAHQRQPRSVRAHRRHLRWLHEQQLLHRLNDRPIGGRVAGSAGFVYALGLAGQRLLRPVADRHRRPLLPRAAWLEHTLAVGHVYTELCLAATRSGRRLLSFQPEPTCWREFSVGFGTTEVLRPDAFLRLLGGAYEDQYFLEVDRGTESPNTLRQKLGRYSAYWQSGSEQAASDVFPLVLWLVPDEQRQQLLRRLFAAQPSGQPALHQVALLADGPRAFSGPPP